MQRDSNLQKGGIHVVYLSFMLYYNTQCCCSVVVVSIVELSRNIFAPIWTQILSITLINCCIYASTLSSCQNNGYYIWVKVLQDLTLIGLVWLLRDWFPSRVQNDTRSEVTEKILFKTFVDNMQKPCGGNKQHAPPIPHVVGLYWSSQIRIVPVG